MTSTDLNKTLGTPRQALAYLEQEKNIPFEAFDAIMHFHILEVPDFHGLRHNYEERAWTRLAGQCGSLANMRQQVLINCAADDTEREALRTQALLIQLLRALSQVATSIGRKEPEMGN